MSRADESTVEWAQALPVEWAVRLVSLTVFQAQLWDREDDSAFASAILCRFSVATHAKLTAIDSLSWMDGDVIIYIGGAESMSFIEWPQFSFSFVTVGINAKPVIENDGQCKVVL